MNAKFDILVGVIVSLAIHGGAVGYGYLFPVQKGSNVPPPPPGIVTEVEVLEEKEEEKPPVEEIVKEIAEELPPETQAAASLPETHSIVNTSDIVIVVPPTPPPQNVNVQSFGIPTSDQIKKGLSIKQDTSFVDASLLDKKPTPRQPSSEEVEVYWSQAKQDQLSGQVKVLVYVDVNGRVVEAEIVDSPDRRLDRAAYLTALRYTFTPATYKGKPTPFKRYIPIAFNNE